jgi:hypothetical protein
MGHGDGGPRTATSARTGIAAGSGAAAAITARATSSASSFGGVVEICDI